MSNGGQFGAQIFGGGSLRFYPLQWIRMPRTPGASRVKLRWTRARRKERLRMISFFLPTLPNGNKIARSSSMWKARINGIRYSVTKVAAGSVYRAAAEAVNTLTPLDISHQTVGRMVRTVGQKYAHSGSVSCERENPSASWLCQKEGPD